MDPRPLLFAVLLGLTALPIFAMDPPKVLDPALKLEALCTAPDIEAPTTVVGAPDGSFYVGCDPRDTRLNTDKPECYIVRFGEYDTPDQIRLPDGSFAPPNPPRRHRTIFAKDIFSPAGSAWHDGWLYVCHNPFLTRFKDTDGDSIADVREDLITNLGMQPGTGLNDHCASGFTLGMDGFFYMSIGDRGTFQTKSVKDGSTISMQGGGIIRFRSDGTALEIFSTGTRNHLAVLLDAEDNAFTLDNTDDGNGWWTRLTHHIEGGYYGYPYDYQKAVNYGVMRPSPQTLDAVVHNGGTAVKGGVWVQADREKPGDPLPDPSARFPLNFLPAMTDFGGGSPTGGLCYLSDGLPEQYRGKFLFSEWGKGGLFVIEVVRDGATFRFVKNTPLIQGGNGIDFRPMQISVAADGSLLIADWQWGGWKGPKTVGTIWRLSWPEAQPAPRLKDESKAPVEELLAALAHPDRDQRLRAESALIAKGGSIVKTSLSIAKDEQAPVAQRMHALWMTQQLVSLRDIENSPDRPRSAVRPAFGGTHFGAVPRVVWWQAGGLSKFSWPFVDGPRDDLFWENRSSVSDVLRSAWKSDVSAVRAQAARALARLGDDASTFDSDSDLAVRLQAAIGGVHFYRNGENASPPTRFGIPESLDELRANAAAGRENYELKESDPLIRFIGIQAVQYRCGYIGRNFFSSNPAVIDGAFQAASQTFDNLAVQSLLRVVSAPETDLRTRAVTALARITYQPKPWDGHWWGTQPVKNPPPLNSVAWEGTPVALQALTAALSDPDPAVRLAAAKGFAQFSLPKEDAPAKPVQKKADPVDGKSVSEDKIAVPVDGNAVPEQGNPGLGARSPVSPPNRRSGDEIADPEDRKGDPVDRNADLTARSTISSPDRTSSGPEIDPAAPPLSEDRAASIALAALRARLTAETDPAVRRQLIESLGVQKDSEAMEVFRQISLDERADAEFRGTAIAAVVNIGGDDARKIIAQLASAPLSPAATRKIIQAAGELRVLEAAPALIAHLSDETAGDRESAIKSLARLGPKSGAIDALLVALADKDTKVQAAAVEALGSFKDQRALPALLDFSKTKRARRETINAIAALMPDTQALPFLVDALREKGTGERRSALAALKKMRAEAWPLIEQNLASGRIPAEFAPEIRAAFDSGVIAKWKLIGPFENVWEAVHPPETDALAGGDFLKKKILNAEGKETGWNDVSASADEGRVDLGKVFKTSGMVCAYVFTEIESPEGADAKLLCGSDDQIAVWLNGRKLHDSGAGSRGFTADQDEVPIHLTKGRNALLVKIGNIGGGWEFAARIPGVDGGKFVPTKEAAPDAKQRAFSLATKPDGSWQNPGDAKRGEKLFFDQTAALGGLCATCHAVRGKGGTVGPDLSAIAVNYRRPELVVSILEPSKTIALGFDQNAIETNGGETFLGALRQETADAFTLVGADAQPHVIKKTDVKTRKAIEQSLMPPGLTLGLKPEDFADLLAYLETLK